LADANRVFRDGLSDSAGDLSALTKSWGHSYNYHVISLDRTPKRYESFLRQNSETQLPFTRFAASDGNLISEDEAVASGLIKKGTSWRTKATIGVAESHRRLWKQVAESGSAAFIFEDDCFVRHDFATVAPIALQQQPDWDVVLFGYNTDALVEFNLGGDFDFSALNSVRHPNEKQLAAFARLSPPTAMFPLRHAFGLCAYAVSPAGAAKLLDKCFPMDNRLIEFKAAQNRFNAFSLDCMMNVFYRLLKAYIFVAPLALPHNDWQASTVDPRRR
jgi:GR25 family glycosyltransferase involved in LPS biosynthesis